MGIANITLLLFVIVFGGIFLLLYLSAVVGQILGTWRLRQSKKNRLGILGVAEGAVFALLGLLVAFTFAGSYQRFQNRKIGIIAEANAIYTAYLRLDLLQPALAQTLREDFRNYLQSRLTIYQNLNLINFSLIDERQLASRQMQTKIWNDAITGLRTPNNTEAILFLLPALNTMFETANAQFAMSKLHPPLIIFLLLMGLAMLASFLTGYSTARKKTSSPIYILSFITVTTLTLYVTFDLELPRLGLLRVTGFDNVVMQKVTQLTH